MLLIPPEACIVIDVFASVPHCEAFDVMSCSENRDRREMWIETIYHSRPRFHWPRARCGRDIRNLGVLNETKPDWRIVSVIHS